jgi:hypothetical protein
MAITTVQVNNKLIVFRKEVTREYIRQNLFSPYIGMEPTAIIRVINDAKTGGEQINIPLIARLKAPPIAVGTLVGNEENVDNYGDRLWIDWARNAVVINRAERQKSSIDLMAQFQPLLADWGKELQRDEIIDTFYAVPLASTAPANLGTTNGQRVNGAFFDQATAAQRNTWLTDNADRVLFGGAVGNLVAGNWAGSAANVTAAMTLSAAAITKMIEQALVANPRLRPYMLKNGREYWVLFVGPRLFRDLRNDATITNANRDARPREGDGLDKNPIFQGGDLLWDGCIIRRIPELDVRLPTTYLTAGSASGPIAPAFLCGQSAMAWCWGQMPEPTWRREDDYQFLRGQGIQMAYGMKKIAKLNPAGNYKEWGVFTGYFSAVANT